MTGPTVNWDALSAIQGWLPDDARDFTTDLLMWQREQGVVTGVLEMGVYFGKYLAQISALVADLGVPSVGVDAFLERHGVLLAQVDRERACDTIRQVVASVSGAPVPTLTLIAGYTRDVPVSTLRDLCPAGYSFISVDAGHDADDVAHDAAMTDELMAPDGAVAFDDVFNHLCPGVAEGFFRYAGSAEGAFAPFATVGNKVFCSRAERHADYFTLAQRIQENYPAFTNSVAHTRSNEEIGWNPTLLGYPVVPFMWGERSA